jgi:hypothetical protein
LDEPDGAVCSSVEVLGEVGAANFELGNETLAEAAGLEAAFRDSLADELAGVFCVVGGGTDAETGAAGVATDDAAAGECAEDWGAVLAGKRMPQKPATGSVNSNST